MMKINEKLEYIKQLDFFNNLNDQELNLMSDISNVTKYPRNSILYYEDDTSDKILFLISGLLKVYKIDKFENEIFLYNIYKNSLITELTNFRSASIQCFSNTEFIEESVVLEVDFTEFKDKFLSQNILNYEFMNEIILKTHQLHRVINRELVYDATAKVASMLNDDLEIFNSLKRHEVSFMLHIQPETLSRVLKKLKRSSIIEIENSKINIIDNQALKSIYQGES